jgi:hypothetical protein
MPGDRAARPCRIFAPELSIIVHNFTHQVLDQLLSHPAVLLASQFRDGLCDGADHFVRFSRIDFV